MSIKFSQIAASIVFVCALCSGAMAQADCSFNLTLYVRDRNGKILRDAAAKLYEYDFYWREQKGVLSYWSLLGVGSKYKARLDVRAEGFEEFQTEIEKSCGWFSYELRLKAKGTSEAAVFEKLATVHGEVVDPNGAVVADTKVILTDAAGHRTETLTSQYGYFFFDTRSGTYSFEFISANPGFKPKRIENFNLKKGYNNLNVALEVRPCEEMDCLRIDSDPVPTNKKP